MNTLFTIMLSLDRKEMTRFKDFTMSPYFNKHVGVRKISQYLNGIYPEFTEENCSNSTIARVLFQKKSEKAAQIPVLLTYIRRLLVQFLDIESYRRSSISDSIYLLANLRKKKQTSLHLKHLEKERNSIEQQDLRDGAFFYKSFLLNKEGDQMYTEQAVGKEKEAFQKKANNLDAYYLSEKLKDACERLVRSKLVRVDYRSILLEAVLEVVQKDKDRYLEIPPVNVYYHIYQMIVKEETEHYDAAFAAVNQFAGFFPTEELQNIYNYLQNYCVYQINKGQTTFLRSTFKLYKIQLEKGLLFINGFLPEGHYKNMVTAGLRLQETEWVRHFLEEYRPLLNEKVRENAYSYNLAEYHYAIKEYKKTMQLLLQVSYADARYSMNAKALLLRTYFDLEEHEALMALCRSSSQSLLRDKSISEFRRKGYKGLFKLTLKASQLRYKWPFTKIEKSKLALERLRKEVGETNPFNRRWLEERLDAIEQLT